MTTTVDDLEKFQQFAKSRLSTGGEHLDIVELAAEWQFRHSSGEHLRQDVLAVQAALQAMDDGETGRSVDVFAAEFLHRNSPSAES